MRKLFLRPVDHNLGKFNPCKMQSASECTKVTKCSAPMQSLRPPTIPLSCTPNLGNSMTINLDLGCLHVTRRQRCTPNLDKFMAINLDLGCLHVTRRQRWCDMRHSTAGAKLDIGFRV